MTRSLKKKWLSRSKETFEESKQFKDLNEKFDELRKYFNDKLWEASSALLGVKEQFEETEEAKVLRRELKDVKGDCGEEVKRTMQAFMDDRKRLKVSAKEVRKEINAFNDIYKEEHSKLERDFDKAEGRLKEKYAQNSELLTEFSIDTLMEDSDRVFHGKGPKNYPDREMAWDIIKRAKGELTRASYATRSDFKNIKDKTRYEELGKWVRDEFKEWKKEKEA